MVDRLRLQTEPALWLNADEDIAQAHPGHRNQIGQALRPLPPKPLLRGVGQLGNHLRQFLQGNALRNGLAVALFLVVGDSSLECADERVAVFRYFVHIVALGLHPVQELDDTRRSVQPHAVAEAAVTVGVVGKDDGDALFRIPGFPETNPVRRQFCNVLNLRGVRLHAFRLKLQFRVCRLRLLEADRRGQHTPVSFGQCHRHRHVRGCEATRVRLPRLAAVGGGDHLQDWTAQRFQKRNPFVQPPNGKTLERQHHVRRVGLGAAQQFFLRLRLAQRVGVEGGNLKSVGDQCFGKRVHHGEVARLVPGAVEGDPRPPTRWGCGRKKGHAVLEI